MTLIFEQVCTVISPSTMLCDRVLFCVVDWEECSDDEDSDGSWVDIAQSSDEETEVHYVNTCETMPCNRMFKPIITYFLHL